MLNLDFFLSDNSFCLHVMIILFFFRLFIIEQVNNEAVKSLPMYTYHEQ